MLGLEFGQLTKTSWSCECYGIRMTRDKIKHGWMYSLHVNPDNLELFRSAIVNGILSENDLKLKTSGNYGLYSTSELRTVEKFLAYVLENTPEVFLTHGEVTVFHVHKYYDAGGRRPTDFWYTTGGEEFHLYDLGIGNIHSSTDSPETDHETWINAVKSEMKVLIDEGHIRSGIKPEKVNNNERKAQLFSVGDTYGHR